MMKELILTSRKRGSAHIFPAWLFILASVGAFRWEVGGRCEHLIAILTDSQRFEMMQIHGSEQRTTRSTAIGVGMNQRFDIGKWLHACLLVTTVLLFRIYNKPTHTYTHLVCYCSLVATKNNNDCFSRCYSYVFYCNLPPEDDQWNGSQEDKASNRTRRRVRPSSRRPIGGGILVCHKFRLFSLLPAVGTNKTAQSGVCPLIRLMMRELAVRQQLYIRA